MRGDAGLNILEKLDNPDKFRFYVVDDDGSTLSSVWFMQGDGQGIYVGPSSLGSALKLSFHPQNKSRDGCDCQFGHPRAYANTASANGYTPMKPRRWKRAETPKSGAIHVASVLFPSDHLEMALEPPSDKKPRFALPKAPSGLATEVALFLSLESPDTLEQKFTRVGWTPIGYSDFPGGEFMSIVVRHADHRKRVGTLLLMTRFPNSQSLGAAPGPKEKRNFRAIACSSVPSVGQPFYLAEVGPVTMTGTTAQR